MPQVIPLFVVQRDVQAADRVLTGRTGWLA
jgi:hypothetical protein